MLVQFADLRGGGGGALQKRGVIDTPMHTMISKHQTLPCLNPDIQVFL